MLFFVHFKNRNTDLSFYPEASPQAQDNFQKVCKVFRHGQNLSTLVLYFAVSSQELLFRLSMLYHHIYVLCDFILIIKCMTLCCTFVTTYNMGTLLCIKLLQQKIIFSLYFSRFFIQFCTFHQYMRSSLKSVKCLFALLYISWRFALDSLALLLAFQSNLTVIMFTRLSFLINIVGIFQFHDICDFSDSPLKYSLNFPTSFSKLLCQYISRHQVCYDIHWLFIVLLSSLTEFSHNFLVTQVTHADLLKACVSL